MNLYTWLLSSVGPLVYRVLTVLGFGWISFSAVTAATTALKTQVINDMSSVGGITFQILSLAGIPEALSIILGALSSRAALQFVGNRLAKLPT
jgi:hypothetical protein